MFYKYDNICHWDYLSWTTTVGEESGDVTCYGAVKR